LGSICVGEILTFLAISDEVNLPSASEYYIYEFSHLFAGTQSFEVYYPESIDFSFDWPGIYEVRLYDSHWGELTNVFTVTVYSQPDASFTISSNEICLGEYIEISNFSDSFFNDWFVYDESGAVQQYSSSQITQLQFSESGEYFIGHGIQNGECSSIHFEQLTVLQNVIAANLSDYDICAFDEISFIASSQCNDAIGIWQWSINGEIVMLEQQFTFQFEQGGEFLIELQVYGVNGEIIDEFTFVVNVNAPLQAVTLFGNYQNCDFFETYYVDNENYNYTWNVSGANSFEEINNGFGVSINWNYGSVAAGGASVIINYTDDVTGCTGTSEIVIVDCCDEPDFILNDGDTHLNVFEQNSNSDPSIIINKNISISGTVHFNDDLTFQGCNFLWDLWLP